MKRKKGYIFTNKKQSKKAIMSTVLGTISVTSLVWVVYLSYVESGNVPVNYGITVILALLFSLVGIVLGILAIKEVDKFKTIAWVGTVLNFFVLAGISGILYMGTYLF